MLHLTRYDQMQRLRQGTFDVLIVGGGINGAVSAAALGAKGLKVALVEGGDFAGEAGIASSFSSAWNRAPGKPVNSSPAPTSWSVKSTMPPTTRWWSGWRTSSAAARSLR